MYDIAIIGGGPAGLAAGLYGARGGMDTVLLENMLVGGQITKTTQVDNYPGFPDGIDGFAIGTNMQKQAERFGLEIKRTGVDSVELEGEIKRLHCGREVIEAKAVIIATGAHPKKLGLDREEKLTGAGVSYCATCDGAFFRNKDVFVIGGGFTAAEESVFLTKFARHVTMLIRKNDFACPASVADKARNHEKITVLFNTVVQGVSGDDGLRRIQYQNTATGEITDYQSPDGETIGVFVFAGYAPDAALVSGIAERDARGYIITDENQKTSVEGLYAAGDICVKPLRQVITAASDGAVAAAALEKNCGALRGEACL